MNLTLHSLISHDYERNQCLKSKFEFQVYNGETYSDDFIIKHFPLKYKIPKRLEECKKLLFFLALNNYNTSVKKNKGIFFTKSTFDAAGLKNVSTRQQSNWIKGLLNCGFLYVVDNKFYFGSKESKSKLYGINAVGIIKSFEEEYEEYSEKYTGLQKNFIKLANNVSVHIYPKENINVKITDLNKDMIIDFTKGTFKDFAKKLTEYNEGKSDFNKKIFKFKLSDKGITGRAYSRYIQTRNDDFYETDRTEWRRNNNLKYKYDIKSAVPRISHLLTTGEWKDSDFDFYDEMLKLSNVNLLRDHIKSIHMRLRFGSSSKKSFNEFCYANNNYIKSKFKTKEQRKYFYDVIKPAMYIDWKNLYKVVEELEGKDHSSSVFYFESYIELYVVWKLKMMGITAYNIYDEFFYDKECDIESVIAEGAKYVYERTREYGLYR